MVLTEEHLERLTDDELRSLALAVLGDSLSALSENLEELDDVGAYPGLDLEAYHQAAAWLSGLLANPTGVEYGTWVHHQEVAEAFWGVACAIGWGTNNDPDQFPLYLNASVVDYLIHSVEGSVLASSYPPWRQGPCVPVGTLHRPCPKGLHDILGELGAGFIPGNDNEIGYVLRTLDLDADTDDIRLVALVESYLGNGRHNTISDAVEEAEFTLRRIDALTELNGA